MKRDRFGRKGAGMVLAMVTMVTVFLLSVGLVTVAILHTGQVSRVTEQVSQRLTWDLVGEAYCAAEAQGISWTSSDTAYRAQTQLDGDRKILCLLRTEDDTPVLTIVLENTGAGYRVIQWRYE